MSITFEGAGNAGGSTASPTFAYPGTANAGDLIVCVGVHKPSISTGGIGVPWTQYAAACGPGGTGGDGTDTGLVRIEMNYRTATAGLTGTSVYSNITNNNSTAQAYRFRNGLGSAGSWEFAGGLGDDNTLGADVSATATLNGNLQEFDVLIISIGLPTDAAITLSSASLSASGVTFSGVSLAGAGGTANGQDSGVLTSYAYVTSGQSSATPTVTFTATASIGTYFAGPVAFMRIREPGLYVSTPKFAGWGAPL